MNRIIGYTIIDLDGTLTDLIVKDNETAYLTPMGVTHRIPNIFGGPAKSWFYPMHIIRSVEYEHSTGK